MCSSILAHLRGRLPETCRRRSGEWRPAAAARNRCAPGGSGPRPPGTTTWLRGARLTDPEEMPEKEARSDAKAIADACSNLEYLSRQWAEKWTPAVDPAFLQRLAAI